MKYWISKNGQKSGPYTMDQIRKNFKEGTILLTDYIYKDKEWISLNRFIEDRKVAIKSPQQNVHGATVTEELKVKKSSSEESQAALVLGIISIVLALVTAAISWIPFIGFLALPLGVIALILAIIGLIIVLVTKKRGMLVVVIGLVFSLISCLLPFIMTQVFIDAVDDPEFQKAISEWAEEVDAELNKLDAGELNRPGVGEVMELKFTSLAGKEIDLADMKGKVVLIDCWATWCGPCIAELPNVRKAYEDYHDKGFEIIGISLDKAKDEAKLKSFVKDKNMPWPQAFDGKGWDNVLAKQYGITSIPATFLVGKEGKIVSTNLRGPALSSAVKKELGLSIP
ncbi:MAG: redoxin domain-containing protein [Verrucomicrobiales bacterium]|nr:redoxin domain-containing protein [Verrucomicrobiales bacterium]